MINGSDYEAWAAARKMNHFGVSDWSAEQWQRHIEGAVKRLNADTDACTLSIKPAPKSCGGPDLSNAFVEGMDREGKHFVWCI